MIFRAAGLVGLAAAASCAPSEPTRLGATWEQTRVVTRYPPDPRARGLHAVVVIRCKVAAERKLETCVVHEETPSGLGFGQEALRSVPDLTIQDGLSEFAVGKTVQFSVTFRPT